MQGVPKMYEISEMACMFGVSRQTLIHYDRIGLFKPASVGENGYRLYAPTQIPELRLICILRDLGLSLREIAELTASGDTSAIAAKLRERLDHVDEQLRQFEAQREQVEERLRFYEQADAWRRNLGVPQLRHYPERRVVFEAFGVGEMNRPRLHTTLMRAVASLHRAVPSAPLCGWGTLLLREALRSEDPIAGAGSFVVLMGGACPAEGADVRVLPEGIYLCQSRWGMPYDPAGIRALLAHADVHALEPTSDAFDFCLLDTTSYTAEHAEDLCCLQLRVSLG